MNQLVLYKQGVMAHVSLTHDEEVKIQALISQNRLPAVFVLNGTRIVSDTILGFTTALAPDENPFLQGPKPSDFFQKVRSQPWYQKGTQARHERQLRASRSSA